MSKKITPKRQAWLDAYFGAAMFDATQAARIAGFSNPMVEGWRLKKRLADEIELREAELAAVSQMSPKEVMERLTTVAREIKHKDHVKALELIAKIHGQLSEKIVVNTDKKSLMSELDKTLAALKTHQGPVPDISVEKVETSRREVKKEDLPN